MSNAFKNIYDFLEAVEMVEVHIEALMNLGQSEEDLFHEAATFVETALSKRLETTLNVRKLGGELSGSQ